MNNLWVFGDSASAPFYDNSTEWRRKYVEWKGYIPKHYTQLLSEYLNLELKVFAIDGASNHNIFEMFCQHVKSINKDDIVIFNWTEGSRFRLVSDTQEWHSIGVWYIDNPKSFDRFSNISIDTVEQILINRSDNLKTIYDEVHHWIHFINHHLSNNKVIHWTPRKQDDFNILQIYGCETILDETKNEVSDLHLSEKSNVEVFEFLKNEIKNIKNII